MFRVMAWKWIKKFQEGHTNVHDESRKGDPSIIVEEIVDTMQEKMWVFSSE